MASLEAAVLPVTPFQQNCTILFEPDTRRAAVVDPGGEVERILAAIDELNVRPEKILLTHGHIDHAGGAAALKEALEGRRADRGEPAEVPIEGPDRRDRFLLEQLAQQGRGFGMMDARDVLPDRWLAEGDVVAIGAQRFAVLHCPGHTPGHIVLVAEAGRFALVGDVLFRGSIGRTDFPYGDQAALLGAIRDKLLPLGDDLAFLCGHGPGSTIGAERRDNPFVRALLAQG